MGTDGNIWYIQSSQTDPSDNNIIRQTLDGRITKFPVNPKKPSDIPRFILSALDGNIWFDMGTKMIKMSLSGTKTEYDIGNNIYAVSIDSDGRLILTSESSFVVLSLNGNITKYMHKDISIYGRVSQTAMDHEGNIWFAERGRNYIAQFKPTTNPPLIKKYPLLEWSTTPDSSAPIAYGTDDNIWFAENKNKIAKITKEGIITEYQIPNSSAAQSLVSDSTGFLWFVAYNKIVSVNMSGIFREYPLDANPSNVISIAHGKLWFTTNNGKIGMFILPPKDSRADEL